MSKIVKCTCQNEYQDKVYGKGNRVANPVDKSKVNGKVQHYRCTVCKKVHANPGG